MKKMKMTKCAAFATSALIAIGFASKAAANIPLVFESGPNVGQVYNGGITIKLAGVTAGTEYNAFGGGPFGVLNATVGVPENVAGTGVTTMNGLAVSPPAGSTIAGEDTWGLFTVTGIFSLSDPINPLWTPNGKGAQINAIYYGGKDFWAKQDSIGNVLNPAGTQTFNGTGLMADFYYSTPGSFTIGLPTARVGNTYPTVNSADLLFSASSVPGFIQGAGTDGGFAATFQGTFNGLAGGQGQTFLDVLPGGSASSQFNTNSITSLFGSQVTDLQAQFTTSILSVPTGWLARVNDPITGLAVPEPTTALVGLGCMIPIMFRRRRQSKN